MLTYKLTKLTFLQMLKKTIYNNVAEIQTTNTTSFRKVNPMDSFVYEKEVSSIVKETCNFIAAKLIHTAKCLFRDVVINCIEKEAADKKIFII